MKENSLFYTAPSAIVTTTTSSDTNIWPIDVSPSGSGPSVSVHTSSATPEAANGTPTAVEATVLSEKTDSAGSSGAELSCLSYLWFLVVMLSCSWCYKV